MDGDDSRAAAIEQKLETLFFNNQQFADLEETFGKFCPFEAMGMVQAEIRHSNFLSYMFDPQRPHGYGGSLLRAFLLCAIQTARIDANLKIDDITPLDIHVLDLENAQVFREWRHIDILVVSEATKLVIAIELKINAKQSEDQLADYRGRVDEEWDSSWRKLFIFLTKTEEEPAQAEASFWIPLGLGTVIDNLEQTVGTRNADPNAKMMFGAYLAMMRREHVKNEQLEKLVKDLWARHGEALSFLADRRPDTLAEVMDLLLKDRNAIVASLNTGGASWSFDSDDAGTVRFAYLPWDTILGFKSSESWTDSKRIILFEIKREGQNVSACLYLGPGPDQYRTSIINILRHHKKAHPTTVFGSQWACLAKSVLYKASVDNEIDPEKAKAEIQTKFIQFAREEAAFFDIHLDTLKQGAVPVQ